MIFIRTAAGNEGAYGIRLDGVKESGQRELPPAKYIQITQTPQPFATDVAEHILQTHAKFVMQVDAPEVIAKLPTGDSGRIECPAEGCGKTYANETTLTKHVNTPGVHE